MKTPSPRVLLIDDDNELACAAVAALRLRGVRAHALRPHASDSLDLLLDAAAEFRPDVILVDVVMPVDSETLVARLRQHPDLVAARIVGCSGHALLARDWSHRLDGFLHKPFGMSELNDVVRELVT